MSTKPRPRGSSVADFRHSSLSVRSVGLISKGKIHIDLGLYNPLYCLHEGSVSSCVSLDFKISSSTYPQPGLPPFQRTTPGFVPTPPCSQLLPAQAETLLALALMLGDTNSQTAAAMTTLPRLHFLPSLPPSILFFGSHKHPGSLFISHYGAAWLPR